MELHWKSYSLIIHFSSFHPSWQRKKAGNSGIPHHYKPFMNYFFELFPQLPQLFPENPRLSHLNPIRRGLRRYTRRLETGMSDFYQLSRPKIA